MATTITFNKTGHDPFIDFLKAYSIICVVIAHCLPVPFYNYILFRVWGDMQVPMFILIQVFHAYKKGTNPRLKWTSLFKRIIIPFVIIQVLLVLYRSFTSVGGFHMVLKDIALRGGDGPGTYYFWVYLQMAIILVLLWSVVCKLSRKQLTIVFALFCIGCEILFSIIDLPDKVYRLLAVRYLFLIPLALIWVKEGVTLNVKNVVLSIGSIVAVIFFSFNTGDLEPFFYHTGWATHRWICYYYLPILLTYGLWVLFNRISRSQKVTLIIKELAKCSYEIFLIQMLVFSIFTTSRFTFIQTTIFRYVLWMIVTFSLSIIGGILFNRLLNCIFIKNK